MKRQRFTTDNLRTDLARRAGRGVGLALSAQWSRFFIQTASTAVLARLLTPDDYGLVAMVLVVSALADQFKDLGLSMATIQRKEITHEQVSSLFWINAGLGLLLAALFAGFAPVVSEFFNRPELTQITVVLASTFLIGGLGVQHQALLKRQMRFGWLASTEVISMLLGMGGAIVLASLGWGYWALVSNYVVQSVTRTTLAWYSVRWIPGFPRRGAEVRSLLVFGGNVSVFGILNYLSRYMDNLLIGRVWGAHELGLYSKAYQMLLLPIQQISAPLGNVTIPTLSILQEDPVRFRRYYLQAVSFVAYTTIPLVAVMAALSGDVIEILLGSQWVEAAPVFRMLAFAAAFQGVSNTNGWLYISMANTGRMARWALFSRPVVVVGFLLGLPWGAFGVATSFTLAGILLAWPSLHYATKDTPVSPGDTFRVILRPLSISLGVFGATLLSRLTFHELAAVPGALAGVAVGLLVFGMGVALWPSALGEVRGHLSFAVSLLKTRRERPA